MEIIGAAAAAADPVEALELNAALRKELISYVTEGIEQSCRLQREGAERVSSNLMSSFPANTRGSHPGVQMPSSPSSASSSPYSPFDVTGAQSPTMIDDDPAAREEEEEAMGAEVYQVSVTRGDADLVADTAREASAIFPGIRVAFRAASGASPRSASRSASAPGGGGSAADGGSTSGGLGVLASPIPEDRPASDLSVQEGPPAGAGTVAAGGGGGGGGAGGEAERAASADAASPAPRSASAPMRGTSSSSTRRRRFLQKYDGGVVVEDFAPALFREVRALCGVGDDEYCHSLAQTSREQLSQGASNAFFFYTSDSSLMVKSVTLAECQLLRKIAARYVRHLRVEGPGALLARFFGLHSIRLYREKFYFVVMRNCMPPPSTIELDHIYDVKGSWVNRNSLPLHLRSSSSKHDKAQVLKDNDLGDMRIPIGRDSSAAVMAQLRKDTAFLASVNVMDYSLLLGVKDRTFSILPEGKAAQHGGRRASAAAAAAAAAAGAGAGAGAGPPSMERQLTNASTDDMDENFAAYRVTSLTGPGAVYLGVIDVLQEWNLAKKAEALFKVHVLQQDAAGISAIAPDAYQERFMLRCQHILVDDTPV